MDGQLSMVEMAYTINNKKHKTI